MKNAIKKINEELEELLQEEFENKIPLVEMVDVSKKRTNLEVIVWVDGPRNLPHAARIKFANSYGDKLAGVELIPMTIDNPTIPEKILPKVKIKPKDVEDIKRWVILNQDLIKQYGNGDIDTDTFLSSIKKV